MYPVITIIPLCIGSLLGSFRCLPDTTQGHYQRGTQLIGNREKTRGSGSPVNRSWCRKHGVYTFNNQATHTSVVSHSIIVCQSLLCYSISQPRAPPDDGASGAAEPRKADDTTQSQQQYLSLSLSLYIYIHIYIYIYICTYTYTDIHAHVLYHTITLHQYTYIYIYICICMYIYIYIHIHTYTYTYIYIYIYI